ncbi:MAG: alpha/beta fold hydrolase [Proteobacteria bacterium]|nr:alpha/beta fold hydrolase [Pseudomonadota bacterium]
MIIYNPGIKPKNCHLQSILSSSKVRLLRLIRDNPLATNSKEIILTTSEAKLQGFLSQNKASKSLYILLSGWEGSTQSTYIQLLAKTLYQQKKASIFRLNYRDHGDSHHLNEEIFHSCRLNEVVEAVQQIIAKNPHENVYLCGFSLGGNFCLRVAAKAYSRQIKLKTIFSISPPLNPKQSLLAIEESKLYAKYFLKKWKKSLYKKHQLFPQTFKKSDFENITSLQKLTENLILKHTNFNCTDEYFNGYRISAEVIDNITVPCHVITSWDDPVIPFADFISIEKKQNIKLITTKHGGHCGFINSWKMHSWIEQYIIANS